MIRPTPARRARWALIVLPVVLTACSSGPGHPSGSGSDAASSTSISSAQLRKDDATVLANLKTYRSKADACTSQSSPVVCLEAADRALGGQIHDYANKLAGVGGSGAETAVTAARNSAQLLANSMEILGDAQPSQANYDQVLNTFNVADAISSFQQAVAKVQADPG